jgi:1,6-anhydro-N-acetylmuramate kinase
MRSIPSRLATAAAISVFLAPCIPAMADDGSYVERSKERLPTTMEIDGRAADALARKSLSELQAVYARLQEQNDRNERFVVDGGTASACDVANTQLLILIGFSVNKLDGEGRHREWMEDENVALLASYRELVAACGNDAGSPAASGITDAMIEAL